MLTHHATVTVAKTALTQIVYETTSDSAYLAMQALLVSWFDLLVRRYWLVGLTG